jgi:hypothetical protein
LNNVSQSNSEILSDGLVHSNFAFLELVVDEGNDECFFSFLSFDEDGVAFEDFELAHFGLTKLDGGVLIGVGLLNLSEGGLTMSLLGAFFWSRIAVDTSFLGGSINQI